METFGFFLWLGVMGGSIIGTRLTYVTPIRSSMPTVYRMTTSSS